MRLLAFGDVCGEAGLRMVEHKLQAVKKFYDADICVLNGENADVIGIRPEQAERLYQSGADVVTLGNHSYHRQQIFTLLEDGRYLIRPHNLAPNAPGVGTIRVPLRSGRWLCVVNLIGRLNCQWSADNPFSVMANILRHKEADLYVVDFHAEATSEKAAFARHFDGQISAVFGTHTHVQTSDARVWPGGTGFITDLGMTGAEDSIMGLVTEQSINMFLGLPNKRLESPAGKARMEGAWFDIDEVSGRCLAVESLRIEE